MKFSTLHLSSFLVFLVLHLGESSQLRAESFDEKISDGPYVSIKEKQLDYRYICNDEVHSSKKTIESLPNQFDYCGMFAEISTLEVKEDFVEYTGNFPVAALSDLHGQYDLMKTLLINNGIIDELGNWEFGKGHFVITGDIFDRGDKVTEILWLIYRLEQQAEAAGGKVHLLLGNHEVMVLNGDLRYLHPKYLKTEKLLSTNFQDLFSVDTVLGQWLRSKSVLVKINNALYAHGGFHPTLAKEEYSLEQINRVFKENLIKSELPEKRTGFGKFLHRRDGPIWYRGYFKDDGATPAEIDLLLSHFEVSYLIVGHTSQDEIETRHYGKVIAIDSSIKKGKYGEILHINGKKLERGTLSGKLLPLE